MQMSRFAPFESAAPAAGQHSEIRWFRAAVPVNRTHALRWGSIARVFTDGGSARFLKSQMSVARGTRDLRRNRPNNPNSAYFRIVPSYAPVDNDSCFDSII
jgi:hypothetical protein